MVSKPGAAVLVLKPLLGRGLRAHEPAALEGCTLTFATGADGLPTSSTLDPRPALDRPYEPREVESRWYEFWYGNGYFTPSPDPSRKSFTIVIPPPNVTGTLTMGHVLVQTLQDVVIRWRRMQGWNALWLPGTDHAGIATQNVVERALEG